MSSRKRQTPEKSSRPSPPVPLVAQRCSKKSRFFGTGSFDQSYRISSRLPQAVQATLASSMPKRDAQAGLMHCWKAASVIGMKVADGGESSKVDSATGPPLALAV